MWTEKYRPKNLKEFVNQKEALEKFLEWIKNWRKGSKALLFYGPPGTGKTALVQAFAQQKNFEFIEMNASDFRSKKQIEEVFGRSMVQKSIFRKSKIFLIDEVDGIAGREDLGGVSEIIKIIKESIYPCVLTANNPYDQKLRNLRENCILVEFKKIHVFDIEKKLEEICKKEGISTEKEVLRSLAKRAEGDLRAAINDLETVARGRKKISLEDLEVLGNRERETNIFEALKVIFKTQSVLPAKLAIANIDRDPEEIFWWIENNVTKEYEKPEEIAKAFETLSKADLFRQRISVTQNWKFRAYMIDLMTGGVALAKKEMYRKFTKYEYPKRLAILGGTKMMRKEEKEFLLKLSQVLHCSTKKIRLEYLPYLKIIFKDKNIEKLLNSNL
ncbi:MAG: replication factor C large subunit [Candidatus Aenigmatarchaeota archaeon]